MGGERKGLKKTRDEYNQTMKVPVAQSDRASASGAEGCGFDSRPGYQENDGPVSIMERGLFSPNRRAVPERRTHEESGFARVAGGVRRGLGLRAAGGARPGAILDSAGRLYFEDEELYIDASSQRIPVDGARLGLKMQVQEMQALLDAAGKASRPGVALRDGSLIMWPLHSEEKTVQELFLNDFLECLDEFRRADFPVASYISYSGGQDVVNALRVRLCPLKSPDCPNCPMGDADRELCAFLSTLRDRQLFFDDSLLAKGKRSQVFASSSAILDRYREHRIRFFYLNVGGEIARVEAPAWVTEDEAMLNRLHAAIMDQCRRSGNYPPYPPVLMEAHEQAVITTTERRLVEEIVEQEMAGRRQIYLRSAKDRSKRTRAV